MPAQVDYILNITQQDKLICQAYSLGTSMSFVFLSERPEYNEKVKLLVAQAPAVRLSKDSGYFFTTHLALVSVAMKLIYTIIQGAIIH